MIAQPIRVVHDNALTLDGQAEECHITVGSPAWYSWLSTATRFAFVSPRGSFTAHKKRIAHGEDFWNAYRRVSGKFYRVYLGNGESITHERLNEIATALAAAGPAALRAGDSATGQIVRSLPANVRPVSSLTAGSEPRARSLHRKANDVLLGTKLLPPVVRPDLVPRPRLIESLSRALGSRLTLISAPAGAGKTTILAQWKAHSRSPIAWVSLDADDNNPTRFWAYVSAALQALRPDLGGSLMHLLSSAALSPIELQVTLLANAVAGLPDDLVLVLDDYHLIRDRRVDESVSFLLDHLPPNLHLVIAARSDPTLPLARLRARGELAELRAADLSFTRDETAAFLNDTMSLCLAEEDVAALERRSEGWIAGLQLAALSMQGSDDPHSLVEAFSGSHRTVTDYLVEEVLRRQPVGVQDFLLRTAILEQLSGPLCEAITGLREGDGQAMLEVVEKANLFVVPVDPERHLFRYHGLFLSSLRAQLRRSSPGQVAYLHRKAFAWYAGNGLPREAIGHALAAGEAEQAADLAEQLAPAMFKRGEATRLLSWLGDLPAEVMRNRPRLCVWRANALLAAGQAEAAEGWLREAEVIIGASDNATLASGVAGSDGRRDQLELVRSHILAVRADFANYRQDAPLMLELSRQFVEKELAEDEYLRGRMLTQTGYAYFWTGRTTRAIEVLRESVAALRTSGNVFNATAVAGQLADVQVIQGRLQQAAETCRIAEQFRREQADKSIIVPDWPSLSLALLYYEWNDLATAKRLATEGIEAAQRTGLMDMLLQGHRILARLRQAEGDICGALDVLREAEQLARRHRMERELARIEMYRARLFLKRGDVEAAARWVELSGLSMDDEASYVHESGLLVLARVLVAQGRAVEAERLLGRLLHTAEAEERDGSVVKILTFQALALQALGQTQQALSALMRALLMAEREGYVRTFVDAGALVEALLSKLLESRHRDLVSRTPRASSAYIRAVLAAFDPRAGSPGGAGPSRAVGPAVAQLTAREIEVLQLIDAGYSPLEIARQLVVSKNTVKSHMRMIYEKLEAHSGPEVIAKARMLKLI